MELNVTAIRANKIIGFGDDVYSILVNGLNGEKFKEGDIIAITSKAITMQENAAVLLDEIVPSEKAIELANSSNMDPKVTELIIKESNGNIVGWVDFAILTITPYGLSSNAGIDLSNCPEGYALLLPKNPDEIAEVIRNKIKIDYDVDVVVLITDSRSLPLRKGATAVAIGVAGMEPLVDEKGNEDLYGYKMTYSIRAIADNVANCANLVMGETNEQTPFAIVRGVKYTTNENQTMKSVILTKESCLYVASLMK